MERKENDELIASDEEEERVRRIRRRGRKSKKNKRRKKEGKGNKKRKEGKKERKGWKVKSMDRYLGIEIDGNGMKRRSEREERLLRQKES